MPAPGTAEYEEESKRVRVRVFLATLALIAAVVILGFQVWGQSRQSAVGSVPAPTGALAGQAPGAEERQMLDYIRKHPELAKQPMPGATHPPQVKAP